MCLTRVAIKQERDARVWQHHSFCLALRARAEMHQPRVSSSRKPALFSEIRNLLLSYIKGGSTNLEVALFFLGGGYHLKEMGLNFETT